ncbi:3-mercaptopyruvate sulfurtransferase-like isoform X2 [Lampetra planeri]
MSGSQSPALVSARWLFENISPSFSTPPSPPSSSPPPLGPVLVLDASWYMPGMGRDAHQEFVDARIPGAAFFDLDESSDRECTFGFHAMPTAAAFTLFTRGLGVSARSHVVVYDSNSPDPTAARVWWMFKVFGHGAVSLLDGGLEAWRAGGFPLETGLPKAPAASGGRLRDGGHPGGGGAGGGDGDGAWLFHATEPLPGQLKSFEEIRDNMSSKEFVLVDSRPEGSVTSSEPQLLPVTEHQLGRGSKESRPLVWTNQFQGLLFQPHTWVGVHASQQRHGPAHWADARRGRAAGKV